MTPEDASREEGLLRNALDLFLTSGFHALKPGDLEAATGESWEALTRRFGDKEALFLAAVEQGLSHGTVTAAGKHGEVLEMLRRLQRANGNPRLRAIHKPSLTRVRTMAEAQAGAQDSESKSQEAPWP